MANSFTTNYNLTKPEEGGANDTWGGLINTNLTTIDSQIYRKVDKADNKGVTHSLTFSGNNITTGTARGFEHIIAGDRIYIANASTETEGSGTSLVYRNRGEFYVDTVVNDTELTLDRADGTSAGSFASETISSVVSLVTIPPFTRQGLTQLAGEIKLFASVTESVIQALGSDTVAGNDRYFWLACNGQAVSRSTYNSLFKVIGTTFGDGDESSTFELPDLRGRVPVGDDTMAGLTATRMPDSADNIGESGGVHEYSQTELLARLPAHTHNNLHGHLHDLAVNSGTVTVNKPSGLGFGTSDSSLPGTIITARDSPIHTSSASVVPSGGWSQNGSLNDTTLSGDVTDYSGDTEGVVQTHATSPLSNLPPYLVIGSYIIAT